MHSSPPVGCTRFGPLTATFGFVKTRCLQESSAYRAKERLCGKIKDSLRVQYYGKLFIVVSNAQAQTQSTGTDSANVAKTNPKPTAKRFWFSLPAPPAPQLSVSAHRPS